MDKMVYGQNGMDRMVWTEWYGQNGVDRMVRTKIAIFGVDYN